MRFNVAVILALAAAALAAPVVKTTSQGARDLLDIASDAELAKREMPVVVEARTDRAVKSHRDTSDDLEARDRAVKSHRDLDVTLEARGAGSRVMKSHRAVEPELEARGAGSRVMKSHRELDDRSDRATKSHRDVDEQPIELVARGDRAVKSH